MPKHHGAVDATDVVDAGELLVGESLGQQRSSGCGGTKIGFEPISTASTSTYSVCANYRATINCLWAGL
jgi:hypothetical protein